jgi:hypothetical protein
MGATRGEGELRVGTSGYQYDHWAGRFYPREIPKRRWFEYYAARFDTVEINNTFHHLPAAKTFDDWRERAPRSDNPERHPVIGLARSVHSDCSRPDR